MILGLPAIVVIGVILLLIFNKDFRNEEFEKSKPFLIVFAVIGVVFLVINLQ